MKHQIHASIYEIEVMLMTVIMKNICNIQSMQGMSEKFNDESCVENLCRILGVERHEFLPHYVTVNEFLKKLDMGELETHERHCPHCLKKVLNKGTKEEKTIYYHHVLEAKLVLGEGLANLKTSIIQTGNLYPEMFEIAGKGNERACMLEIWLSGNCICSLVITDGNCQGIFSDGASHKSEPLRLQESMGQEIHIFEDKETKIREADAEMKG